MSDRLSCAEVRDLAPEFALGIASGDERAGVLEHIATCEECRRAVRELSSVADEILLLAPERQAPIGFESSALRRMTGGDAAGRRSRWWSAAAVLAAVIVGAASVWLVTADDRRVGSYYKGVLAEADGDYFTAAQLTRSGGARAGVVFAYEGHPSWIFVVLQGDVGPTTYECWARTENGKSLALGAFGVSPERSTWGTELDGGIHDLDEIRLEGEAETLIASFGD